MPDVITGPGKNKIPESLPEKIQGVLTVLKNLQDNLANTDGSVDKLNQILANNKADNLKLQGDLDKTTAEKQQALDNLNKTTAEKQQVLKDLEARVAELNKLKSQLEAKQSELQSTLKELEDLKKSHGINTTEYDKIKAELAKTVGDLSSVQAELTKAKTDLARIKNDATDLANNLVTVRKERDDLKTTNSGLSAEIASLKKENEGIKSKFDKLSLEKETFLNKIKTALGLPNTATEENVLQIIGNGTASRESLTKIAQILGLPGTATNDEIINAVIDTNNKLKAALTALTLLQERNKEDLAALQTQVDTLTKNNTDLKKENASMKKELETKTSLLSEITNKLEISEKKIVNLNNQLAEANVSIKNNNLQITTLNKTIDDLKKLGANNEKQILDLSDKVAKLTAQNGDLERTIAALTADKKSLLAEKEKATIEITTLQKEITKLASIIEELRKYKDDEAIIEQTKHNIAKKENERNDLVRKINQTYNLRTRKFYDIDPPTDLTISFQRSGIKFSPIITPVTDFTNEESAKAIIDKDISRLSSSIVERDRIIKILDNFYAAKLNIYLQKIKLARDTHLDKLPPSLKPTYTSQLASYDAICDSIENEIHAAITNGTIEDYTINPLEKSITLKRYYVPIKDIQFGGGISIADLTKAAYKTSKMSGGMAGSMAELYEELGHDHDDIILGGAVKFASSYDNSGKEKMRKGTPKDGVDVRVDLSAAINTIKKKKLIRVKKGDKVASKNPKTNEESSSKKIVDHRVDLSSAINTIKKKKLIRVKKVKNAVEPTEEEFNDIIDSDDDDAAETASIPKEKPNKKKKKNSSSEEEKESDSEEEGEEDSDAPVFTGGLAF